MTYSIRTTSQWLNVQRCVPMRDNCHSNYDRVCFRLWFQRDSVHHGGKGPATVKESMEAGIGVGQSHFDSHTGSREWVPEVGQRLEPLKAHLQWRTSSSKAPPSESSMTTPKQHHSCESRVRIHKPMRHISPSNPHIIKAVGCCKENHMTRMENEEINLYSCNTGLSPPI